MRRWLGEPLVHFLALGALLFFLSWLRGPTTDAHQRIVIRAETVDTLREAWRQTWGRDPTADERDTLVEDQVREEIFYREAQALGLDREDPVVKRRLRDKLEFVLEDVTQPDTPGEAELQSYLDAHADAYRVEPSFTFEQVFLGKAPADAARLLARLRAGAPAADLGQRFPLGRAFDKLPAKDVERIFGPTFEAALQTLEIGSWSGPIESSAGLHLVRLTERVPARTPTLDEVRSAVLRDRAAARQREASEAEYRKMRARYEVVIETPSEATP
jgi:hypothetical protein